MAEPKVRNESALTQARLRELLHYDPATGVFTWLQVAGRRVPRRIGSAAGSIHRSSNSDRLRYLVICLDGRVYRAHRLAFLYMTGKWPQETVDHIDGDGLNNRWINLRPASVSQNAANSRRRSDNKTGYKGVSFHKRAGRYIACMQHRGEYRYLGLFDTPEEAHAAYSKAHKEAFGEFTNTE